MTYSLVKPCRRYAGYIISQEKCFVKGFLVFYEKIFSFLHYIRECGTFSSGGESTQVSFAEDGSGGARWLVLQRIGRFLKKAPQKLPDILGSN